MPCTCEICKECAGNGDIWFSIGGKYLGKNRCDDLDRIDVCPYCHGDGVSEVCDECREAEWE